jgi:hypothetical protein
MSDKIEKAIMGENPGEPGSNDDKQLSDGQHRINVIQCNTRGGGLMAISLRLSDGDSALIKQYAEVNGLTVSEFIRQTVIERIENEYDLKAYEKAMKEYRANPVTYTLDEVERDLGLT